MPRKPDRKTAGESPIQTWQQQLARQEEQLKAKLNQTQKFLGEVPALKDKVQKKQQQEIFDRFNRPARLEGPIDFRLELVSSKKSRPQRTLRKERSKAPLLTLALLITFVVVAYFAWQALYHG